MPTRSTERQSVAPLSLGGPKTAAGCYRVSVYPMPDDDGGIERVVVLADDQTALHAIGASASRVSFKRLARTANAIVVDQVDARNRGRIARRRSPGFILAASVGNRSTASRRSWANCSNKRARNPDSSNCRCVKSISRRSRIRSFRRSSRRPPAKASTSSWSRCGRLWSKPHPDRLAQVFVNLIDNALRHTRSGRPHRDRTGRAR